MELNLGGGILAQVEQIGWDALQYSGLITYNELLETVRLLTYEDEEESMPRVRHLDSDTLEAQVLWEEAEALRTSTSFMAGQYHAGSISFTVSTASTTPIPEDETLPDVPWVRGLSDFANFDQTLRKEWHKLYYAIEPILNGLFPEAWDLEFGCAEEGNATYLTLLFHDVAVQAGEDGPVHHIRELYVRMVFIDAHLTGTMDGTRGEVTDVEFHSSYAHSHLDEGIDDFSPFCRGTTHMVDLCSTLGLNGFFNEQGEISEFALLQFEAFLHQVGAFVAHEATDGVPYKRIRNIGKGAIDGTSGVSYTIRQQSLSKFISVVVEEDLISQLSYRSTEGIPEIVYSPFMEQILLRTALVTGYHDPGGLFYTKLEIPDSVLSMSFNPEFRVFTFRGKEVEQQITHPEKKEPENRTLYCHEQIRNYVIRSINERIRKSIRGRVIEEASARASQGETTSGWREVDPETRSFLQNLVLVSKSPLN